MRRWLRPFSSLWPILLLTIIWGAMITTNLLGEGEWLMGYDNLLPELNLPLWWERNYYSIWQDYRGLGAMNTVAEGTELTRLPIVWLIKIMLGERWVRFAWSALMLYLGSVGTYLLTYELLKLSYSWGKQKISPLLLQTASLLTSLWTLWCPATIQLFYTPLESFSGWFGFLPLILWRLIHYLRTATNANLLWLTLICLLASSAFHLQTLFVVLVITILSLIIAFSFSPQRTCYYRRLLIALSCICLSQAFWLLPMAFTTLHAGNDFTLTKQNLITTPQVQEMNYSRGNFANLALLHGYWFDYREYRPQDHSYTPYLGQWQSHWQTPLSQSSGYLLFIISILGLLSGSFLAKRREFTLVAVVIVAVGLLMLTAGKGVILGLPFRLLAKLPLISDIFRVAFTKWSTVAALGLGLGLAHAFIALAICQQKFRQHYCLSCSLVGIGIIGLLLIRSYPIFTGQLFGWQVKVALPERYANLAQTMKTQNHAGTTIYLPQPNYWGWLFYDWGYRGSGFMWQLIPQPLLDRNFDAWSLFNQTAYQQFNLALQKNQAQEIANLINKYQLQYAIVDGSLMEAGEQNEQKRQERNEQIIALLKQTGAKLLWSEDNLSAWQLASAVPSQSLSINNHYHTLLTDSPNTVQDFLYQQVGDYFANETATEGSWFPFAHHASETLESIACNQDACSLSARANLANHQLIIPRYQLGENLTINGTAYLHKNQQLTIEFHSPGQIQINERTYPLPNLKTLHLEKLSIASNGAYLDFGDQTPYLIQPETNLDFTLNLKVGQILSLKTFPANMTTASANNIKVDKNQVKTFTYPESIWAEFLKDQSIPLSSGELKVSWRSPVYTLNTNEALGQSCDVSQRGQASKKVRNGHSYYATSGYGSWCESYYLANLATQNDYLLKVTNLNLAGQPLRFRLVDENSGQTILTHKLTNSKKQYFYLPASATTIKQKSQQWFFYLTAQSYGQESINELQELSFIYYPLKVLSRLKVVPKTMTLSHDAGSASLTKLRVKHRYDYRAWLNLSSQIDSSPLLILARSYHPFWVAKYRTQGGSWQTLPHYRFNSWANAWLLPTTTNAQGEIKIIFYPQLLVPLGWLLLLILLISLLTRIIYCHRTYSKVCAREHFWH